MNASNVQLLLTTAAIVIASISLIKSNRKSILEEKEKNENKRKSSWTAEDLIASRRSIFPDTYDCNRQVPKDILEKMLEAANWAPTHARTEPWRFVVFSTLAARKRLGEFEASLYKAKCPVDKFQEKKYQKKIKSKEVSSYVIAICLKRQKSEKIPEIEEICSVACAVQNMHLTATAYGVGGYWSSGDLVFSNEMKEFLNLEEKDKCLGLFYVGYPVGPNPNGHRKPMSQKVQWITE